MTRDLDRRLEEAEQAQRAALPRWQDDLRAARSGGDTAGLAALLGIPTRRQVLRVGGFGIAGAALLAACSGDDDAGDDVPPADSSTITGPEVRSSPAADVVLANTAVSLEVLAIDAYRIAGELGLVTSAPVSEAFAMFQAHHAAHRDVLVGLVEAAGGVPFTTPNPVVRVEVVEPALQGAATEGDLVRLAHDIERSAAQAYVWSTGTLSTAELRGTAMSIGAVESRHAAILAALGELAVESPARYPAGNPLPLDAIVEG